MLPNSSSRKVKIAFVGDSEMAQSYAWGDFWPTFLVRSLNQNGVSCEGYTYAVNANTYYRLNNEFPFGSQPVASALRSLRPQYIFLSNGTNDTINPADGRTLSQVQDDAREFVATLREDHPDAIIYYVSQSPYDSANFTPATLKNKGAPPAEMALPSSGILQDKWTSTILEDPVSATLQTELSNFDALEDTVKAITDGSLTLDSWRAARLGLLSTDGYHFMEQGHLLMSTSVIDGLVEIGSPLVAQLSDQLIGGWDYLNDIFEEWTAPDGDGYTTTVPAVEGTSAVTNGNIGFPIRPDRWFTPYRSTFDFYPTTLADSATDIDAIFTWIIEGAQPNTAVMLSVNGGAFAPVVRPADGTAVLTDSKGSARDQGNTGASGFVPGAYTLIFSVGDEAFDAITVTVS